MKFYKTPKILFAVIIFLCLTAIPLSFVIAQSPTAAQSSAQSGVPFMGLPPQCLQCGNCSTCDIINAAINIGKFLIGIIGSLVLVYFIYGGIYMLVSHGNADMVGKGKKILINSVIGLVIVMLAYVIVNFAVLVATGGGITNISQFVSSNLTCSPTPACAGSSTPTSPSS